MKAIIGNFKLLAIETENQIKLTHGLLSDFNIDVLEKITAQDDYIDNLKTIVENACFSDIYNMKRSPDMAPLNRIRALHIICVNLERIADFCVNIARQTQYLTSKDFIQKYDYQSMFLEIQQSVSRITRVFDHGNLSQALEICRAEFKLDDLWEHTFNILLRDLKKGDEVTNLVTTIFIFRYLERIGDSILNIGEALIFAIMGDRIKIRQVEALEKTLTESGFKGTLGDIDFASIWGSRSGCRISKVSRKKPSGFQAQGIFKEGKILKIQKERANINQWEKICPGVAPKVFGYYEKYRTASLLVEFLSGCTLDQVFLSESSAVMENAMFVFEQTLTDIWHKTLVSEPCPTDYMFQLMQRFPAICRVHPDFLIFHGPREGSHKTIEDRDLIQACHKIEKGLPAPFSIFIHGDFNTNNIVYNHEDQKIHYIDLYRSRQGDYVQDAAVFLVSNFRVPVFDVELRARLNKVSHHFYNVFHHFAFEQGDLTFNARLSLALARSFLTSTRFELNKEFSGVMCQNARILMERVMAHHGKPWENFPFPGEILHYDNESWRHE
ncbi:Phosphate uptake regulator [Desulfocicer vacuolatum DSM 3385]|uniref:Phosphate uptake regulator n=1 Tax=Desulfocicer vacuolatum DSM 3385 TaxID=1121400 RepID=A0A1W2CBX0_9BACT|nr:PhoU domain-containing protein [Desulfocicer vacuolatum]SMC82576.1 Phosphate uptake regulator [Desulfocicer vacuolatum DSM 3385]